MSIYFYTAIYPYATAYFYAATYLYTAIYFYPLLQQLSYTITYVNAIIYSYKTGRISTRMNLLAQHQRRAVTQWATVWGGVVHDAALGLGIRGKSIPDLRSSLVGAPDLSTALISTSSALRLKLGGAQETGRRRNRRSLPYLHRHLLHTSRTSRSYIKDLKSVRVPVRHSS